MREFKDAITDADHRQHDDDAEFPGLSEPRSSRKS
jgi:hypothetical protein